MRIRFVIPASIFLIGPTRELLDISASFVHGGYAVRVTFPDGEASELQDAEEFSKYFRVSKGLRIGISEQQGVATGRPLAEFLTPERRGDLLHLICAIGSRVCRAIRNFAYVPEMPERLGATSVGVASVESCLRKFSPEVSTDGEAWAALLDPTSMRLRDLMNAFFVRDMEIAENAELKVVLWSDVVEALEDNKEPPPEREFFTNAVGHLRQKNFRLAVLESIICLEIVLSQYLSQYLAISAGVPKKRLKTFLSPEVGLTARLSALLNLTLHESYLEDVNLDKVLKVVEWRNEVIHTTGRLPGSIREDTLRDNISQVLSLVRLLAERRDNVAASTELMKITEALRTKERVFRVQIWLKASHHVRIDVEFLPGIRDSDYRGKLDALAREAGELLKNRDARFDPAKHLMIHFKEALGKSLGLFGAGSLTIKE